MAKGIGNGVPLAAVVTTPEIAQTLTQRIHFNTFGGNPVSCAAGKAVLEVIEQEKLQQNCLEIGEYLMNGLNGLMAKYDIIGDVRGKGLILGVELVKDRSTKAPAKEQRHLVQFQTTKGDIFLELYNETPQHRDNFIDIIEEGVICIKDGKIELQGDHRTKVKETLEKMGFTVEVM